MHVYKPGTGTSGIRWDFTRVMFELSDSFRPPSVLVSEKQ